MASRSASRTVVETISVSAGISGSAATSDFGALAECDVVLICVPTPLTKNKEPDLSAVVSVATKLAHHLRPDRLVVLESTTYPGTTEEVLLPILTAGGLKAGQSLYVAFSPERVDPGDRKSVV